MLITSTSAVLKGPLLRIPPAIRAPLNLDTTTRVFGALATESSSHHVELIASPFPPSAWADLWRIEMDIINSTGILRDIVALVVAHGLQPMSVEASLLDAGDRGTISLLVDLNRYSSPNDSTTQHRSQLPRAHLPDLHARIAATFVQHLAFHDGQGPRLRIRRLHSHHRLHQYLQSNSISLPIEIPVSAKGMRLPTRLLRDIADNLPTTDGDIYATFLSDSKDRVMRVIFSRCNSNLLYIRVYCRNVDNAFSDVLSHINKSAFDIVRCVQRPGLDAPPEELLTNAPSEYITLDLAIRSKIDDSSMNDERLLNILRAQLCNARELANCNIHIVSAPVS